MTGRVTNSISFQSGDPHGACNGLFRIELEGLDTVELRPHQAFIIPKRLLLRPVVPQRSAVLMIERADVVATGN